jgi:uncharacterized protein (DUF2384 family)
MTSDKKALNDLAERGLETSKQIDQLIDELWQEFQRLEPDLAGWLLAKIGSQGLAALMAMDRVHDNPSLLEVLASDGVDAVMKIFNNESDPRYSVSEQEQDKKITESLSDVARQKRSMYEFDLLDIFKQLQAQDPEVAEKALDLWEDAVEAAEFLVTPSSFYGKSPLEMLEEGNRQEVFGLIGKIIYGLPT